MEKKRSANKFENSLKDSNNVVNNTVRKSLSNGNFLKLPDNLVDRIIY